MMAWLLRALWMVGLLVCAMQAHAHNPFDGNVELRVRPADMEVKVTLGYDAARAWMRAAGVPAAQISAITRGNLHAAPQQLPPELARRLLILRDGERPLPAHLLHAWTGNEETSFVVTYPLAANQALSLSARYFDAVADIRPGSVAVIDADRRLITTLIVQRSTPMVFVPLTVIEAKALNDAHALRTTSGAWFMLGLEHILHGYDHLLFLCSLLLTMHKLSSMLGIITAFTLSHSITLALAALDVITIAPAVIEPMIAISIIVAAGLNFLQREVATERYAMAVGFGLIHGFGFAGGLREAGFEAGGNIVSALLPFNLGVECGQLAIAVLLLPMMMLTRRQSILSRYAAPVLNSLVITVSTYWLVQRLVSVVQA